jgi:hypothetical protein
MRVCLKECVRECVFSIYLIVLAVNHISSGLYHLNYLSDAYQGYERRHGFRFMLYQ